MSSEQSSRLENGALITPTVERVVRLLYAAIAKLSQSETEGIAKTAWTAELNQQERVAGVLRRMGA